MARKSSLNIKFDIHKTITYRGWIIEVLKANNWSNADLPHFKKCMLLDTKSMAKTWLKDGRRTYLQTYYHAVKVNIHKVTK